MFCAQNPISSTLFRDKTLKIYSDSQGENPRIPITVYSRAETCLDYWHPMWLIESNSISNMGGSKNKSCPYELKKKLLDKHIIRLSSHYLQNVSIFTNKKVLFLKKNMRHVSIRDKKSNFLNSNTCFCSRLYGTCINKNLPPKVHIKILCPSLARQLSAKRNFNMYLCIDSYCRIYQWVACTLIRFAANAHFLCHNIFHR